MSVTVADVLLHGRDMHPGFDRRWAPDGPVLRFLSRYQQELLSRLAQIKRDAVQLAWDVDVPVAADWEDGETVPARILVHGGTVFFNDTNRTTEPLAIVEFAQRFDERVWGVYFLGGRLRFMGIAEAWADVDHVTLYYFPEGDDLAARSDEFVLPGQCLPVLVEAAAAFLGKLARARGQQVDVEGLMQTQRDSEDIWLDAVTNRRRAVVGTTKSLW